MDLHHETLVLSRAFRAPAQRLFDAYVDPVQRSVWSAPSDTAAYVIDRCDFRTGGTESARCGSKDDLRWRLEIAYHRVDPGRLILLSEELWDGADCLCVSLVTFDFAARGGETLLTVTDQIASMAGPEIVSGHRQGYTSVMENLDAWVRQA